MAFVLLYLLRSADWFTDRSKILMEMASDNLSPIVSANSCGEGEGGHEMKHSISIN